MRPNENKISLWDPFKDLRDFQKSFFGNGLNWPTATLPRALTTDFNWNPSCELNEDTTSYQFQFDLPGVTKDNIKIDVHENVLTVSGERREEKKSDDKKNHFSETFYGSFSRSFTLPTAINLDAVKASYDNGVLKVVVPKPTGKMSTSKRIEIN